MYKKYLKRICDYVLAASCVLIISPLIFLICVGCYFSSGSPVFFKQNRAGLFGKTFRIMKFRTMSDLRDSEGKLLPNKERVTALGGFLRKYSLDELPGLFNVLLGDMSLIGPRPLRVEYLNIYNDEHSRRHDMLPGITGLAQVSGRNSLSWEEKFDYDVKYIDQCSLSLDFKIILLTVVKIIKADDVDSNGLIGMTPFTGYDNDGKRSD